MSSKTCEWGKHQWRDAPSKLRPGWVATVCRKCGKFLGRRPGEDAWPADGQRGPGGTWRK